MQINGYMGAGLNPFISRFGVAQQNLLSGEEQNAPTLRTTTSEADQPLDTNGISQTFAQDIVNRISTQPPAPAAKTETGLETGNDAPVPEAGVQPQGDAEQKDPSALQDSLARAVDFVRANFGDSAAQATMGLVYKHIGTGEVSEESLGKGLLDALRFIDRNFGFAAGDKLMAHFNQGVNQSINDYFDNGLMEVFYAAPAGGGQQPTPPGQALAGTAAMQEVAQQYGEEAVASIMDALESALQETKSPAKALRQAVEQAGQDMAEQYGGEAAHHQALIGQSLAPLLHGNSYNALIPHGANLDLRV